MKILNDSPVGPYVGKDNGDRHTQPSHDYSHPYALRPLIPYRFRLLLFRGGKVTYDKLPPALSFPPGITAPTT
jgi:hypothetical protein